MAEGDEQMLGDKKVAIVGLGKIGGALALGLIQSGAVQRENVVGSTAHRESADRAAERFGIRTYLDNAAMVTGRDIVILAIKPQRMARVLEEIREAITEDQLVITIAAAITCGFVEGHLSKEVPVIRAMPNTPCLINRGMTVLCPGRYAREPDVKLAEGIFGAVGLVEVIDDEELMDAVTGLSGSGPAYAYVMVEALAEGGVKMGLPRRLATTLAAQSLLGGAGMVLATDEHPAKLKDMVTTPAGVTIDGLTKLEEGGLRVALIKAVVEAAERSKELSR